MQLSIHHKTTCLARLNLLQLWMQVHLHLPAHLLMQHQASQKQQILFRHLTKLKLSYLAKTSNSSRLLSSLKIVHRLSTLYRFLTDQHIHLIKLQLVTYTAQLTSRRFFLSGTVTYLILPMQQMKFNHLMLLSFYKIQQLLLKHYRLIRLNLYQTLLLN